MADVTIHVDKALDELDCQQLKEKLAHTQGVSRVRCNERHPNLFVVDFDPDEISTQAIISEVSGEGLKAELVGL